MKSIIFEGLDGSGKTTLFKEFEKRNSHYHACFDRFPTISSYVYDRFFHRFQYGFERMWWLDSLLLGMRGTNSNVVVVHVDTAPLTCLERRDDEEDYTLDDYEEQRGYYVDVMNILRKWKIPVLVVNGERDPIWNTTIINQWIFQMSAEEFTNGV